MLREDRELLAELKRVSNQAGEFALDCINGDPPVTVETAYAQPVRCVLEMDSDGQIAVIVRPGCSVSDVHDMLRLLTLCEGRFEHLTFVDEGEVPSFATANK